MQQIGLALGRRNTYRVPAYKLHTFLAKAHVIIHRCGDTEINDNYRRKHHRLPQEEGPLTLQTQGSCIIGFVHQVLCCGIYLH